MRTGLALASFVLGALCLSCRADTTAIVVGIQSDPMGGIVSALHVVIRVAGAVVDDERIAPPHGSKVGFPQPWEKTISGAGKRNAEITVQVDAIGDPASPTPLLTRLSSTHFVPGRVALLRIPLESRCVVYPPTEVPPIRLETYAKNWPGNAPDRCKQANGGPPDLQVGTGQSYYLPLAKGQVLQAEAGPQGGHHIWIATRMKNLKQAGSTTRITGVQPETGAAIPPTTLAFTYAPDEGGYCKLFGIRYQLDNEGIDYKPFLGKPLDLTVTVTDTTGATVTATSRVQIAPTVINP